jgi:hypothetical protein
VGICPEPFPELAIGHALPIDRACGRSRLPGGCGQSRCADLLRLSSYLSPESFHLQSAQRVAGGIPEIRLKLRQTALGFRVQNGDSIVGEAGGMKRLRNVVDVQLIAAVLRVVVAFEVAVVAGIDVRILVGSIVLSVDQPGAVLM